ncbi:LADA_0E07932g1_1 [Lachancea dasiensis]|uniref:LADA_0E07932g1_1 n=1 Tax=Lachancea dasiensis TaxID=1072105 RepID=A0A1G4JD14_9SACH|nr:LADA_0E07932g1_1 [Lachancea dasiensis]
MNSSGQAEEVDTPMTEHVSVYTPIGHSGVPLPHDYFQDVNYEVPKSATPEVLTLYPNDGQRDMISNLPTEVKMHIAHKLSQYDLISLAAASSLFQRVASQALYSKIVVDANHSYLQSTSTQRNRERATYIKTRYNFNKLIEVISRPSNGLGALIKCFEIIRLPDGMHRSEIQNLMCNSLPAMTNLCKIYCGSDAVSIPPRVLQLMPNKREVEALAVNVDLRQSWESIDTFENIQKLSIFPFVDSQRLASFLSKLLTPCVVENLTTLRVGRDCAAVTSRSSRQSLIVTGYMLNNNLEQPDVVEGDAVIRYNQLDLNFWEFLIPVANSGLKMKSLNSFEISGVSVIPEDSSRMVQGVDLTSIRTLSFLDMQEVQLIPEVDYEVSDFTSLALQHMQASFLGGLAPYLRNLQKLRLDYREPVKDSVHEFLRALKEDAHASLQELDLNIHWDDSKLAMWPNWETLALKYMDSILLHAATLQKLSLVAYHDFRFYSLPKRIPSQALIHLRLCRRLQSLRLHGESLHPMGGELISQMAHLRKLDLVGVASGGAQHMALQVMYAGVLDRWYRVIHVAIALARSNPGLQLIRIDKCLFECLGNGTVGPKTDDEDFDTETRVLMSEKDWV